jgi:5-methylcytosine-specific restriction protein A
MNSEYADIWQSVRVSSDPEWDLRSTQWVYEVVRCSGIDDSDERLKFDVSMHGVHPVTFMGTWVYVPYSRESIGCLLTTEHYRALVEIHGAEHIKHCGALHSGLDWVLVDGRTVPQAALHDGVAAALTSLKQLEIAGHRRDDESSECLILLWNPKRWAWPGIEDRIADVARGVRYVESWKIFGPKQIRIGMPFLVMRTGDDLRGIVASGIVVSPPHETEAFDEPGKTQLSVAVQFDAILHPTDDLPLHRDQLLQHSGLSDEFNAPIRRSGHVLSKELGTQLSQLWRNHLAAIRGFDDASPLPFDEREAFYSEGALRQLSINAYERSGKARDAAIRIHGTNCFVCEMNFEEVYGPIGKGFIHVHHRRPISESGGEHRIDPNTDLVPVCPNCHSMLHRRTPPYTVEEMKGMMGRTHNCA